MHTTCLVQPHAGANQSTQKYSEKVTNDTDTQSLQDDLETLVNWSEKWQMLLNCGKCKCIHIGHGNMGEEYKAEQ